MADLALTSFARDWDEYDPLLPAPDEYRVANQALKDYALMGPHRSFSRLARQYHEMARDETSKYKPPTTDQRKLSAWSKKYDWPARIERWEQLELEYDLKRWRDRRNEFRTRQWELAEEIRKKITDMLKFPLARTIREDDGKTIIVLPAEWKLPDVARLAKTYQDLADLATSNGKQAEKEPQNIVHWTPEQWKSEQTKQRNLAEETLNLFNDADVIDGETSEVEVVKPRVIEESEV